MRGCIEGRVLTVLIEDQIVGVIFWQQLSETSLYFGPFAVAKSWQGKGVGKLLLQEVERIATERNLTELVIKVVNHRTDLIPWYQSLGYRIVSEVAWPESHSHILTKPSFFYEMKRSLILPSVAKPDPAPVPSVSVGFSGGCHCQSVRYQATIDPYTSCYCHCSICRHISGTIVVPWASIPSTHLQIITGKEHLTTYHSSSTFVRQFCSKCGSQLFFFSSLSPSSPDEVLEIDITYGSIDETDRSRFSPTHHIWFDSKDSLEYSEASLPKYAERRE
jgi:hypothetical protein